jgi:PIN domain nuclease of toxin-antitoxin system
VRLLLDTNVFIWSVKEQRRLSVRASKALRDPRNELVVSHASIWEIVTKALTGKLSREWTPERIQDACDSLKIDQVLSIELKHIYQLRTLPPVHNDPFDRLLVAQAQIEKLRMVTSDSIISDYYLPDAIW